MTPETYTEILKIVGLLFTGGIGVAIIQWLASMRKNRAATNIDIQDYWHKEFKRLDERIADLEAVVKGRDVTIAELKKENAELRRKIAESEAEIVQLTSRIRELERLIEQYNIQDYGDEHGQ